MSQTLGHADLKTTSVYGANARPNESSSRYLGIAITNVGPYVPLDAYLGSGDKKVRLTRAHSGHFSARLWELLQLSPYTSFGILVLIDPLSSRLNDGSVLLNLTMTASREGRPQASPGSIIAKKLLALS